MNNNKIKSNKTVVTLEKISCCPIDHNILDIIFWK